MLSNSLLEPLEVLLGQGPFVLQFLVLSQIPLAVLKEYYRLAYNADLMSSQSDYRTERKSCCIFPDLGTLKISLQRI